MRKIFKNFAHRARKRRAPAPDSKQCPTLKLGDILHVNISTFILAQCKITVDKKAKSYEYLR